MDQRVTGWLESPEMGNIQEVLQVIAEQEGGERFLNCVLQRFAARVNQLPLPELAMVVHVRGDAKIVFAPNRGRLEREFGLADATELAGLGTIRRCLGAEDAAIRASRADVERRLRILLANAALRCAEAV